MSDNIFTVTKLNYTVRHLLESGLGHIWLMGEISNFSQPVSGHWYLSLKDENAQVKCAMFKMKNQRVNFRPQNGMQILVRANVSLYEPRGDYQLILESMQLAGDGLLQQQFEQLKQKLAAEGLFATEHKKAIPHSPKRVGVITSASGAALQDILHILKRRDPNLEIVIYPTLVQGKEAVQDIVATLDLANQRNECDLLILGRGGGSLEDLWCFNEELVARAIFRSQLPIISAVGHEIDFTIADFVADLRAATPSAAAELVSRDQQERKQKLNALYQRSQLAFDRLWADKIAYFEQLKWRLNVQHPARQLQQQFQQLTAIEQRITRAVQQQFERKQQKLHQLAIRVQNQHPQRQLERQKAQLSQWQARVNQQFEWLWQRKKQQWQTLQQRLVRNPLPHQVATYRQQYERANQRLNYAIEKKFLTEQQKLNQLAIRAKNLHPKRQLERQHVLLNQCQIRLNQQFEWLWQRKRQQWHILHQRLVRNPLPHQISTYHQQYEQIGQRLTYAMEKKFLNDQQKFRQLCAKIEGINPLKILARGYSVTSHNGQIIHHVKQVAVGDQIRTQLSTGEIISQVLEIK